MAISGKGTRLALPVSGQFRLRRCTRLDQMAAYLAIPPPTGTSPEMTARGETSSAACRAIPS
jgi:hypothetical protein